MQVPAGRAQSSQHVFDLQMLGVFFPLGFLNCALLQDAILKLGPLPRLLNDISVALRNPQLHMPTNHQPDRPKDRLFSRPSFNRLKSSDFQSHMMRDLNRSVPVPPRVPDECSTKWLQLTANTGVFL